MTPQSILGETSPTLFLDQYWQQRPLLVRAATTNYKPPLTPDDMASLSLQTEVESRLVTGSATTPYQIKYGPQDERTFTELGERDWTLLVQALDLWEPQVAKILEKFHFLARWKLDDIMASFAVPGGSVGPHFDQYDVFLLQVQGQRRWLIGDFCNADTPISEADGLRLLQSFEPQSEWLLDPGDMLYLPPGVAHWGIAETAGITYSVGFRSPTLVEVLDDLTIELGARGDSSLLLDPRLNPSMASDTIDPAFINKLQQLFGELVQDKQLLGDCIARYMTRPKYPDLLDLTEEKRRAQFNGKTYLNGELTD